MIMHGFVLLRKIATLFLLATSVAVLSALGFGMKRGDSILSISLGAPLASADAPPGTGEGVGAEGCSGESGTGCDGSACF